MKKIILYNLVAVIILFSSMEIATRTISWISGNGFTLAIHEVDPTDKIIKKIYKWHPFVGFTFNPMSTFIGSHQNDKDPVEISIDHHGFLSKNNELELTKKNNEIRIATIGGSTTANVNLTFDQNWPGYLGNLIQQEFPEKIIRVINAGIPGFDTAQSIGNLALRVMPFKPDIVIIYHAYNDLKAIRNNNDFKPDYSHIHSTPFGFHKEPSLFIKTLSNSMLYVKSRNLFREMKKNDQEVLNKANNKNRLFSIPKEAKNAFEEHIKTLVAIAKSGGASVVLSSFATLHDPNLNWNSPNDTVEHLSLLQVYDIEGLFHFIPGLAIPAIFEGINQYNETLHRVSIQDNTGWIDNGKLVPHEDPYFVDRVHFSSVGAKLMAENFFPLVKKIIRNAHNKNLNQTVDPTHQPEQKSLVHFK